jgi:hypothetical protein
MRRRSRKLGLYLAFLALGGVARADQQPVLDCPWISSTPVFENFGQQSFYLRYYPGTSLKQVTLYVAFPAAGAYTLALQLRSPGFKGTGADKGRAQVTVNVTASSLSYQPVTFDFGTVAIPAGAVLTFETQTVSKPAGVTDLPTFQTETVSLCPVIETDDATPPLSNFRRNGIAVRITGDPLTTLPHVLTFPSVASAHGANGTFFHSDVWLANVGPEALNVTARYRCWAGQNCGTGTVTFAMEPSTARTIPDVVQTLFGAPETAGALELSYSSKYRNDALIGHSRVYTPSLPSPTNGAAVPGLGPSAINGDGGFLGLGNNGGDRSSGFRSNAGVYNPNGIATNVTFQLVRLSDGTPLGHEVTQTWAAFEARQINDVFAAAGAGDVVTTDAALIFGSTMPVFAFVTVIDNQSGDSIFLSPAPFLLDHY